MNAPIPLPYVTSRTLQPCAPFHFDGTVCKPSYFPGSDTAYQPGCYWQSMRFAGQAFGIRLRDVGAGLPDPRGQSSPAVELSIYSADPLAPGLAEQIAAEIAVRFDLHADLREFYEGFADDPLLAPALARWCGVRASTYTSLYEYLVIATTLQNATVRRTVQMMENLFNHFGSRLAFDGQQLSAYWEPQAIHAAEEDTLRALKLGYRAKTLKRQAQSFVPGSGSSLLDENALRALPSPELKKALLSLYGVGPASVWYLLFGQFKRYDAFETISPWEQKIYARILFDAEEAAPAAILAEVERRWGRWKMMAAHLLFEDLFWRRKHEPLPWLEELIRL